MYRLYTSNTCPKGVAAQDWLISRGLEAAIVNLDAMADQVAEHKLRLLIRGALGNDEADVILPVLSRLVGSEEQLELIGFEPNRWEEKTGKHEN